MTSRSRKKPNESPDKNAIGIMSFFLRVTTGHLSNSFLPFYLSPLVNYSE